MLPCILKTGTYKTFKPKVIGGEAIQIVKFRICWDRKEVKIHTEEQFAARHFSGGSLLVYVHN